MATSGWGQAPGNPPPGRVKPAIQTTPAIPLQTTQEAAVEGTFAAQNINDIWYAWFWPAAGAATINGTATAPLGAITATATATVKHVGTGTAPLGSLTATASSTVKHVGTGSAPLGALTVNATGTVTTGSTTRTGTAAAPLGSLTATATATVKRVGTGAAPLGALTASATGSVTHPGTATAPLGSLTAAASATVLHVVQANGTAPLTGLTATATGRVTHVVVGTAPLGELTASALMTGGTAATDDDGHSHSWGRSPKPRQFPQQPKPTLARPPRTFHEQYATASTSLGGLAATATADIAWSVLADEEELLALI